MKNFRIISSLGEGSFGKVELAIHEPTAEKVAIKTIAKKKLITKEDLQMANKEIAVFKCVNHPNIIRLYQIAEDQNYLYLIMEHADKGDLLSFIKNNGTLSEMMALNFIKQLAEAVQYLHAEKSIAHRDIKLANILMTSKNNNVKLADFGLSNFYDKQKQLLKTCCGSPCYSAPQILIGSRYNPAVADIWSLGIVLYSMIEGCLPFYHENVKELYKQVIKGNYCEHEKASRELRVLIKKILQINPQSRIKIADLIRQVTQLMESRSYHRLAEIPTLAPQTNEHVEQIKHENVKKILLFNNYEENEINQVLQFRKNFRKPRRFNQLNTFIQLLQRKPFNKLNSFLSNLAGQNKQNQLKVEGSLMKRTLSNFTRDTLKTSKAQQKLSSRLRFVRNNGIKSKNINLAESEPNQEVKQKAQNQNMRPKHRRKNSELVVSLKQGLPRTARIESKGTEPNQSGNGYIRLNKKQQDTLDTETQRLKCSLSSRPRNMNLSLSSSNKPNERFRHKLRVNQSVNQSLMQENHEDQISDGMDVHKGIFNIMSTFNGQISNQDQLIHHLKSKFSEVEFNGNFKYTIKQEKGEQRYQIGILRVENFSNLKYIKIEPFSSQIMYQLKKTLNSLEKQL